MRMREHTLDLIMAILLSPSDLTMKNHQDKLNVTGNKRCFSLHQAHIKAISKYKPSSIDSFRVV